MKNNSIQSIFLESIKLKTLLIDESRVDILMNFGDQIVSSIKNGGKIMFCGNGGSAADAQHLAAEMLIRLKTKNNREGIAAMSLAQDTSTITACGNDLGYEQIYMRVVESLGKKDDILLCITTSGNSKNIVLAMKAARKKGIKVFGFLGADGGDALDLCDESFVVPSSDTGRVQEAHITAGHALMEYVEDKLIKDNYLHLQEK